MDSANSASSSHLPFQRMLDLQLVFIPLTIWTISITAVYLRRSPPSADVEQLSLPETGIPDTEARPESANSAATVVFYLLFSLPCIILVTLTKLSSSPTLPPPIFAKILAVAAGVLLFAVTMSILRSGAQLAKWSTQKITILDGDSRVISAYERGRHLKLHALHAKWRDEPDRPKDEEYWLLRYMTADGGLDADPEPARRRHVHYMLCISTLLLVWCVGARWSKARITPSVFSHPIPSNQSTVHHLSTHPTKPPAPGSTLSPRPSSRHSSSADPTSPLTPSHKPPSLLPPSTKNPNPSPHPPNPAPSDISAHPSLAYPSGPSPPLTEQPVPSPSASSAFFTRFTYIRFLLARIDFIDGFSASPKANDYAATKVRAGLFSLYAFLVVKAEIKSLWCGYHHQTWGKCGCYAVARGGVEVKAEGGEKITQKELADGRMQRVESGRRWEGRGQVRGGGVDERTPLLR